MEWIYRFELAPAGIGGVGLQTSLGLPQVVVMQISDQRYLNYFSTFQ
jgi:hypothetical protein